jgi:hypothetical protein
MRVFSVARNAAFPELPLASTQNLTIPASRIPYRPTLQNTPKVSETEYPEDVLFRQWPDPPIVTYHAHGF